MVASRPPSLSRENSMMERRPLGRTGLEVSALCLGTMTFGEQNTEAEAHAQLDRAFERGIDFFDMAEMYPIAPSAACYGRTEEIVGSWVRRRGLRDRVVLATKMVGRSELLWYRDGKPARLTRAHVEEAVDGSLRRLGTDHIDVYQTHWPDRHVSEFGSNPTRWRGVDPAPDETPLEETLEAMDRMVKAGKIRHFGLSNETPWGVMTCLRHAEAGRGPRVASLQNAYSLLNRTFEGGLAEICLREGVGLLGYSPLAQGYLSGKYRGGALPEGSRKALFDRLQRYEKPHAGEAMGLYFAIAERFGVDPAIFAIAFARSRPFMTSVIIGATTMRQLETALAAAAFNFTPEMEAAVDAVHQQVGNPAP